MGISGIAGQFANMFANRLNPTAAPTPAPTPAQMQPAQMQPAQPNNVFGQASGALTDAMGGARNTMGFQGQQVGTQFGYTPGSVGAQRAVGGIETYMNPYTQQVVDLAGQDIERQRQMAQNQLGAQASAAGAFGGSRQGVAEAMTNSEFARQMAETTAGLRQQGFNTALGASQQDVANQLQASLANQSARARANEFGQGMMLDAQRANQSAEQQAAQLRFQGAGQLGGFGQAGFGMGQGIIGMQQDFGRQQQMMNQQLIDAARGQYGGFTGAPQNALATRIGATTAGDMGQQTQTQTRKPGLFDYLQLGAQTYAGMS